MQKTILITLFISIAFLSCKKRYNKLELAKEYYEVLNNSNYSNIFYLLADSIISKEIDYKKTFSQEDYIEFLKWDSTFESKHEVLEIKEEGEIVRVKVSQNDKRILFLHEQPIITNQIIRFNNGKISNLETVEYVFFNDSVFIKNRTKLLNWVDKNHPELKGFLYDQTQKGGLKYLKAIELYQETNK